MKQLTPDQRRDALFRLANDFDAYSRSILRIRPKSGGSPVPFIMNTAQRHIHRCIATQEQSTGKVRAIILKGRQQGASTYTEGRFYWRITHRRGVKGYILTHEQKATDNLFGMVERYYQEAPTEYRPHLGASNAKELIFDLLDSRYEVATAGSKDTGRSGTAQYLHGSEVGFWQHAAQHMAGIGQVVPDAPGTEIILESTANGTANVFHEFWQMASKGKSEYMPVFVPWYWQDEYQRAAPPDLELMPEDEEYREAFGNLSIEQMAWRRNKIDTDFRGDVSLFDQEYPASAELAFASSSPRALIKATLVGKARRNRGLDPVGPRIMAVDPAEYGDDSTSVMFRQGRVSRRLGKWNGLGTMETVGRVGLIADREKPDVIFVDATGIGTGVADRLKEEGYPVVRVHFGESPRDGDRYVLMRDELWGEMADWLADEPASIEDDDDLASQLTSVQYSYDSKRRLKMEPKEKMKERGLHSPDDADSLALTFARGSASSGSNAEFRRLRGYED
jgi:hypothetical protein